MKNMYLCKKPCMVIPRCDSRCTWCWYNNRPVPKACTWPYSPLRPRYSPWQPCWVRPQWLPALRCPRYRCRWWSRSSDQFWFPSDRCHRRATPLDQHPLYRLWRDTDCPLYAPRWTWCGSDGCRSPSAWISQNTCLHRCSGWSSHPECHSATRSERIRLIDGRTDRLMRLGKSTLKNFLAKVFNATPL